MKPLCKAKVPNKRFHDRPAGEFHHPCPFHAKQDGYCIYHHPSKTLAELKKRHGDAQTMLHDLEKQITATELMLQDIAVERESPGNPS